MSTTKHVPGGETSIPYPWALICRGGGQEGHRPFTRMAYFVKTAVGEDGKAVALFGLIGNGDCQGWTKHLRRVEWSEIVKQWCTQPSAETIRKARARMPKLPKVPT